MFLQVKQLLQKCEHGFLRFGALLGVISAGFVFYNGYVKPAKPTLVIKFALNNSDEIPYEVNPNTKSVLANSDLLPAGIWIKNIGEVAAKNVVLGVLPDPPTKGIHVEVYGAKEKMVTDGKNSVKNINYIDIGTINPGETAYVEKEINAVVDKDVFISNLDNFKLVLKDGRSVGLESKAWAASAKMQIYFSLTAENMKRKEEKVMSLLIGNTFFYENENRPHFIVNGNHISFDSGSPRITPRGKRSTYKIGYQ